MNVGLTTPAPTLLTGRPGKPYSPFCPGGPTGPLNQQKKHVDTSCMSPQIQHFCLFTSKTHHRSIRSRKPSLPLRGAEKTALLKYLPEEQVALLGGLEMFLGILEVFLRVLEVFLRGLGVSPTTSQWLMGLLSYPNAFGSLGASRC